MQQETFDYVYFVCVHNAKADDFIYFDTLNDAIAYADEREGQGLLVTVEILC